MHCWKFVHPLGRLEVVNLMEINWIEIEIGYGAEYAQETPQKGKKEHLRLLGIQIDSLRVGTSTVEISCSTFTLHPLGMQYIL